MSRAALIASGWRVVWVWECALIGRLAQRRDRFADELFGFISDEGVVFGEIAGVGIPAHGYPA